MKNLAIAAVIIVILYYVFKKAQNAADDTQKRATDNMPLEDAGAPKNSDKGQGGQVIDSVPVTQPIETPLEPFVKGATTVKPIPQNTAGDDSKEIKNGSSDKIYATPLFGNPVQSRNMGAANDITKNPVVKEATDSPEIIKAKAARKNITPIKMPKIKTEIV